MLVSGGVVAAYISSEIHPVPNCQFDQFDRTWLPPKARHQQLASGPEDQESPKSRIAN